MTTSDDLKLLFNEIENRVRRYYNLDRLQQVTSSFPPSGKNTAVLKEKLLFIFQSLLIN